LLSLCLRAESIIEFPFESIPRDWDTLAYFFCYQDFCGLPPMASFSI
jgi:hypothetical protein